MLALLRRFGEFFNTVILLYHFFSAISRVFAKKFPSLVPNERFFCDFFLPNFIFQKAINKKNKEEGGLCFFAKTVINEASMYALKNICRYHVRDENLLGGR